MSKLSVRLSGLSSIDEPPKQEPKAVNIQSILEDGRKINFARCNEPRKQINPEYESECKKVCDKRKFQVYKLEFPPKPEYPRCAHHGNLMIDRRFLTRQCHDNLLAMPKVRAEDKPPKWVRKTIPPASCAVEKLAQPSNLRLLNTFNANLRHMPSNQLENILDKMFKSNYQTPAEALRSIKQIVKDRKTRIQRQWEEIKRLRKVNDKKMEEAENLTCRAIDNFKEFILNGQEVSLDEQAARYSDAILAQICHVMKQKTPQRNSTCLTDRALCKIADKIACCMAASLSGLNKARSDESDECKGKGDKKCFEIKDYYPRDVSETVSSTTTIAETEEMEAPEVTELDGDSGAEEETDARKKLSFLRKSQIQVNRSECERLFNVMENYHEEKAQKLIMKSKKKQERDNAKNLRKAKKQRAKRESSTGSATDCLGDVNKKPQWEVEWIEK